MPTPKEARAEAAEKDARKAEATYIQKIRPLIEARAAYHDALQNLDVAIGQVLDERHWAVPGMNYRRPMYHDQPRTRASLELEHPDLWGVSIPAAYLEPVFRDDSDRLGTAPTWREWQPEVPSWLQPEVEA